MRRPAFTLVELLLVIGIIAVLAFVAIVAINPAKQLADARNAQRRSDVNAVLNAISQYTIDSRNLPAGIPVGEENALEVCRAGQPDCTGYVDLSDLVPTYIVTIPEDPQLPPEEIGTYYAVYKTAGDRVTVFSILPEGNVTIAVSR